jgi:hypothetical protein
MFVASNCVELEGIVQIDVKVGGAAVCWFHGPSRTANS